jgi:hypothetical protein
MFFCQIDLQLQEKNQMLDEANSKIQKLNGIVSAAFTISNKQGLECERLKMDNDKLQMYVKLLEDQLQKKPVVKEAALRQALQQLNTGSHAHK